MNRRFRRALFTFLALALIGLPAQAAIWSNTELHIQFGTLDTPTFAGGGEKDTKIFTFQHASGWKYGDNFFFFDVIDADGSGFNDLEIYGEWYPYFSLGKMSGKKVGGGKIKDIRVITGLNYSADANVLKYLPGIGLSMDFKGFAFFNIDITAYIDASDGVSSGGAPAEDDSFMIDLNWARPFKEGKFSIEGHIEYIGERTNEFGGEVSEWVLAQPQFRFYPMENLAIGIEYQYWMNKLGDSETDESAVQALLVWKF
ncbi:MAG: nucleoside-binding protein [bacterium]|nr:nucleoside-binding protein [bacterium]